MKNNNQMENLTNQDKAIFFALYWGQDVKKSHLPEQTSREIVDEHVYRIFHLIINGYLELKALRSISEEDANHVYELNFLSKTSIGLKTPKSRKEWLVGKYFLDGKDKMDFTLETYDYLRSKGYALPWRGISVDELVKIGFIKLID